MIDIIYREINHQSSNVEFFIALHVVKMAFIRKVPQMNPFVSLAQTLCPF